MLLLVALLFAGAQTLSAQRTITGTVISADDNMGVPGAQVIVRGTTMGTTTDINGRYSINVPATATHLVFTFMGMETQEIEIGGQAIIDVTLSSGIAMLQEFIVTGYGVTRRASFTGTATQVGDEVIRRQTDANVINTLQGAVPGLQVSNASGQPGSASTVRIRGLGSINAPTAPLFVIDGVPITTGNISGFGDRSAANLSTDPLAALNPADIESITVLRDAAATAIFGARASNGVILITTRRGQEGQNNVNVSLRTGLVMNPQNNRRTRMLNARDYEEWMIHGFMNRDEFVFGLAPDRDRAIASLTADGIIGTGYETDWLDAVTRVGRVTEATVSASGGTARANYFLSLGYTQNESFVTGSDFERISARTNLEFRADRWITMGLNLSGSHIDQNQTTVGTSWVNPLFASRLLRPNEPIRNPDGSWNLQTSIAGGTNPVAIREDGIPSFHNTQLINIMASPFVRLQLMNNLFVQVRGSLESNMMTERQFWSPTVDPNGISWNGLLQRNEQQYHRQNITNTVNWLPTVGDRHRFNVMLGQEAQKITDNWMWGNDSDFPHPTIQQMLNGATSRHISSGLSYSTILSFFGSLEYELDDKYYIAATVRRDASSRFADAHRWGTFYSIGAKWRISHEPFMEFTRNWLDNLTLRASFGVTGNEPMAWYGFRTTYATGVNYSTASGTAPSIGAGNPGNDDLRWERKNRFDIGFNLTALNNRLDVEFVFYNDVTNDLLYTTPITRVTGHPSLLTNVASMRNRGVEVQVNALLVNTRDFQWSVGANMTANRNKVLDLGGADSIPSGALGMIFVGQPFNVLYMREWGGVCPHTGLGGWVQEDGSVRFGTQADAWDPAPRRIVGDPHARFFGGLNTRLAWRNFDFTAHFFYTLGSHAWMNEVNFYENTGHQGFWNVNYYTFDNSWRQPGDQTLVPRFILGQNMGQGAISTRMLMSGDFLRLRSITLGYTVPRQHLQRLHLQSARVYASFDNIFTWTHRDFRGWEPDAGLLGSQGVTFGQPRTFTVGLNVGF